MMSFDRYRLYTQARIGLGHAGPALPTKSWLLFALNHAQAVDAIKIPWDLKRQSAELHALGIKTEILSTKIADREHYLLRPDLGRLLSDQSRECLKNIAEAEPDAILIIASNGLSSLALNNHLANFLGSMLEHFKNEGLKLLGGRLFLVENARVGLIDDIGQLLKAKIAIVLIGERPGLSSPDSLAAYLTYEPRKGRSDAERNCISNIRPPFGLSYKEGALKLQFLINESRRRKLSGVSLKEESSLMDINPKTKLRP